MKEIIAQAAQKDSSIEKTMFKVRPNRTRVSFEESKEQDSFVSIRVKNVHYCGRAATSVYIRDRSKKVNERL